MTLLCVLIVMLAFLCMLALLCVRVVLGMLGCMCRWGLSLDTSRLRFKVRSVMLGNQLGYHLERNPMTGVRRRRYFNERDRRLQDGEEVRLLDAARREDQLRSMELRVKELVAAELARAAQLPTHYSRLEARKGAYEATRRHAITEGFTHVPFFEAFVQSHNSPRRCLAAG